MNNYSVKMGFGLHIGWAIEGAIGSEYKIDASYLSPNVNMASRLEAATKQYGVPLLISGELFRVLTPETQGYCRHIDTVTVKGSSIPMQLYTSDMELIALTPSVQMTGRSTKDLFKRKKRVLKQKLNDDKFSTGQIFEDSQELQQIRIMYDHKFDTKFAEAMESYISGSWGPAKEKFDE